MKKRIHRFQQRAARTLVPLVTALLLAPFATLLASDKSSTVLGDFESDSWGEWTVEGSAFGSQPFTGTKPPQVLLGRKGEGAVNSWAVGGDGATGKLTSKPFEISRPFIGFLLGGGKAPENVELGVRLEVAGQVVRRATGRNSDAMEWVNWDVSELLGKTGRIIIEDASKDPWGHVVADHFVLSPVPMPAFAVASPFGDHMVLQREKPVNVWGRGLPGDTVRVTFAGQTKEAQADASRHWRVELDPMPASAEGRDLAIEQVGGEKIVFTDVLVGEVWLAGGQSNMGFVVNGVLQAEKELASANLPTLRIMQMPFRGSAAPLDMAGGKWAVATPQTIAGFSGVAFFFARSLIENLGVPVGVIKSSVGGTAAEQWTPAEVLAKDPEWNKTMVEELAEAERNASLVETFQQDLKAWSDANGCPEEVTVDHSWADPALETSDWKTATVPIAFGTALDTPGGGNFWMRKDFDVPEEMLGKPASVVIGTLDRQLMHVFLNGKKIGTLGDKAPLFYQAQGNRIALPGNLLKPGRNVLAIRCTAFAPGSAFRQPANKMELPVADPATLDGTWLLKAETRFPAVSREAIATLPNFGNITLMNASTGLYNAMIHPLVPFTLRGVIWYQGESNAFKADRYKDLLTGMITEWRARFGQGDFPFYQVQLANYYDPVTEPVPTDRRTTDDWVARVREAQLQVVQSVPETGMAVAIDVGEKNIHPLNKQDVGDRLARLALAKTYGLKDIEHAGPAYASMSREGASIRVKFAVGTGGLMIATKSGLEPAKETPDAKLAQFAIAGADQKFVWADATIDGSDAVVVSSPSVPEPVAVRYAWSLNPAGCNLYGRNGLPASPFRTDNWPLPEK